MLASSVDETRNPAEILEDSQWLCHVLRRFERPIILNRKQRYEAFNESTPLAAAIFQLRNGSEATQHWLDQCMHGYDLAIYIDSICQ